MLEEPSFLQSNDLRTLSLWLHWRNLRISLVLWQILKMSEPPMNILSPLSEHFKYLFDATDTPQPPQLQECGKVPSKGWLRL